MMMTTVKQTTINIRPHLDPQIIKISGKNTFLEIMHSAFGLGGGKVYINFMEYDADAKTGSKIRKKIPIYIDIGEWVVLAHDVLSGRICAKAKKETERAKTAGEKYCRSIYDSMGGTSADRMAKQGKTRSDKMSESRIFKITPGAKAKWVFSAEKGPGKEMDTGLIAPAGKPEEIIRVPVETDADLKRIVLLVQMHLQAYMSASYGMMMQQTD